MMNQYEINHRIYTATQSLPEEMILQSNKNYVFDLNYLSNMELKGERGHEFLQGQLTCDLREVNSHTMQQGVLCNLKGRILALLDVVYWNHFNLVLPQDLCVATQASLNKVAPFFKVALEVSQVHRIFGFYLQNAEDKIPWDAILPTESYATVFNNLYCAYHLGQRFYIFIALAGEVESILTQFTQLNQMKGSLTWHALQLQQKQVSIYPESRGLFLPHRLDLHLKGYLSFNKGCYKGQEIIARTHYKAKLKHTLKVFQILTEAALVIGMKLLTENNQEVGELIDYCPIDDNQYLVAASMLFEHPAQVYLEGNPLPTHIPLQ